MPRALPRAASLVALLAWLLAAPSEARVYRWVDASGTPHFTDRVEEVPAAYRDQADAEPQPADESAGFYVVPGLNAQPEGEPVRARDDAALERQMREALEQAQRQQRGSLVPMLQQLAGPLLLRALPLLLLALFAVAAFGALILKLACRVVGERVPGFGSSLGIVFLQMLASLALGVLAALFLAGVPQGLGAQASQFGLSTAVNTAILRGLVCESLGKALAVTLMVMVLTLGIALGLGLLAFCAGLGSAVSGLGAG